MQQEESQPIPDEPTAGDPPGSGSGGSDIAPADEGDPPGGGSGKEGDPPGSGSGEINP